MIPHKASTPKLTLKFTDFDLATAGTCEMGFCLPIKHEQYDVFEEKLVLSFLGHDGLKKVDGCSKQSETDLN